MSTTLWGPRLHFMQAKVLMVADRRRILWSLWLVLFWVCFLRVLMSTLKFLEPQIVSRWLIFWREFIYL
jgi:hypothetical protein